LNELIINDNGDDDTYHAVVRFSVNKTNMEKHPREATSHIVFSLSFSLKITITQSFVSCYHPENHSRCSYSLAQGVHSFLRVAAAAEEDKD
jgi:hypothetical protein